MLNTQKPVDIKIFMSNALDIEAVKILIDELHGLRNNGVAVLLTTHDPGLIDQLADRRLLICNGEIQGG